MLWVIDDKFEL